MELDVNSFGLDFIGYEWYAFDKLLAHSVQQIKRSYVQDFSYPSQEALATLLVAGTTHEFIKMTPIWIGR